LQQLLSLYAYFSAVLANFQSNRQHELNTVGYL